MELCVHRLHLIRFSFPLICVVLLTVWLIAAHIMAIRLGPQYEQ